MGQTIHMVALYRHPCIRSLWTRFLGHPSYSATPAACALSSMGRSIRFKLSNSSPSSWARAVLSGARESMMGVLENIVFLNGGSLSSGPPVTVGLQRLGATRSLHIMPLNILCYCTIAVVTKHAMQRDNWHFVFVKFLINKAPFAAGEALRVL